MATEILNDPLINIFDGLDPRDLEIKYDEVKPYPGSKKGPEPVDDPDFYAQWLLKNMPEAMKLLYSRIRDTGERVEEEFKNEIRNDMEDEKKDSTHTIHPTVKNVAESPLMNFQYVQLNMEGQLLDSGYSVTASTAQIKYNSFTDLPEQPENTPISYENELFFMEGWQSLRTMMK